MKTIFPKNDEGAPDSPRSFGIWLTMITIPVPTRNPFITGPEIRLTRNPSRSSHATTDMISDEDCCQGDEPGILCRGW